MGENVFDILNERGFIAQCTDMESVKKLLNERKVTFYIGFDPTADSLHVGHLIALMTMTHMQRAGHRPICLVGGGTGTIGDPTGRSDLRKILTDETIEHNCECFKKQMAHFIDFDDGKALIINNSEWLRKLGYIEFLREIGTSFTINRMLTSECYKQRWEKGLTFLEFNYMIMQAYDFYKLNMDYKCVLQMGGDDQWSNIIAGVELVRRKIGRSVFGLTNKLLLKSDGTKMGKTSSGALWLDKNKISPYDFYQYWRNIDDADVKKCLSLLTFLPMEEINELTVKAGSKINKAKEILAYEVTKLVHGTTEAGMAQKSAIEIFSKQSSENMPSIEISNAIGKRLLEILTINKIVESNSEGRRLIVQGGLTLNNEKVSDIDYILTNEDFVDGKAIIRKGKKKFYKLIREA